MEDFSKFIHEEIFILNEEIAVAQSLNRQTPEACKLAVITGDISEEENLLLKNILSALKLDEKDILKVSEVMNGKCSKWLIFGASYQIESRILTSYQPIKIGESTFVLAQPLSVLRESQEEKQKLWNSLKSLFGI